MTIYGAAGEFGDFALDSGSYGTEFSIITDSTQFRNAWARYGLRVACSSVNHGPIANYSLLGPVSQFHMTARVYVAGSGYAGSNVDLLQMIDPSGVVRLAVSQPSSGSAGATGPYVVTKVAADGTRTTLFTTGAGVFTGSGPDLVNLYVDYATEGALNLSINGVSAGAYAGDVTTDGATQLAAAGFGVPTYYAYAGYATWSEIAFASVDLSSLAGILTMIPSGAGNSDQWSGAYSNVNQTTPNVSSPDYVNSSAQLQEYTTNAPSGEYTVTGIVVSLVAYATEDSAVSGIEPTVRVSGTDYSAPRDALGSTAACFQAAFGPNESNVVALTLADLGAGFNIGYRSAT